MSISKIIWALRHFAAKRVARAAAESFVVTCRRYDPEGAQGTPCRTCGGTDVAHPCLCGEIQHLDPKRHFKGCPKRHFKGCPKRQDLPEPPKECARCQATNDELHNLFGKRSDESVTESAQRWANERVDETQRVAQRLSGAASIFFEFYWDPSMPEEAQKRIRDAVTLAGLSKEGSLGVRNAVEALASRDASLSIFRAFADGVDLSQESFAELVQRANLNEWEKRGLERARRALVREGRPDVRPAKATVEALDPPVVLHQIRASADGKDRVIVMAAWTPGVDPLWRADVIRLGEPRVTYTNVLNPEVRWPVVLFDPRWVMT